MPRVRLILTIVASLVVAMAAMAPGAAAQDDASDHPLVGSWTTTESSAPDGPPNLVAFHPDGTAIFASADEVALGSWSPTGASTADLTLVFPQTDPEVGPTGIATARASIEVSADGGTFTGTYTFEFPTGPGETTGQIGPGEVTGARIAVEPMGEPVAPFEEASPSPSAQGSPAAGSPAPAASPIVLEVSPPPGSLPLPEVSPQESPAA